MIEDEAPRTWPEAVANFEKKLDAASSDLAAHLRDKTQPPPNVQVRVRQLAVDCVASSATLRAEHEAAVRANAEAHPGSRVLLRVATGGSGMTSSGSDRLVVAYKSVRDPMAREPMLSSSEPSVLMATSNRLIDAPNSTMAGTSIATLG